MTLVTIMVFSTSFLWWLFVERELFNNFLICGGFVVFFCLDLSAGIFFTVENGVFCGGFQENFSS
jgi:hypothetical protein